MVVAVVAAVVAALLWMGGGGRSADVVTRVAGAQGGGGPAIRDPRARPPVDLETQRTGSIAGSVTDDAGAPIAGATVCTTPRTRELAGEDTRDPLCVATGDDGRYELTGLVPARYSVSASAPRHLPDRWRDGDDRDWLWLALGEHRGNVDIRLRGGAVEVTGVVLDIGGGPVAGARVTAWATGSWRTSGAAFAVTGDDGAFSLWTRPGEVWINATAEGYARGQTEAAAPSARVEVLLTPESAIAGRVVEVGTGTPVARALVTVEGDWSGGGRSDGSAFTDADGRFRIARLEPGNYKPVAEGLGSYGEARESVHLGLGETVEGVIVEVHPARIVAGRVVIAGTEQPCPEGWVSLRDEERDRWSRESIETDGRVELRSVLPGTYKVRVSCEGYLERDKYPEIVVAKEDQLDLVWEVDGGATLTGAVVGAGGEPVADASVRVQSTGGDPRGQRKWEWDETRRDGSFRIEGLMAGAYTVGVHPSDHPAPKEPTKVELAAGETKHLRIELDAGGSVRGVVVDDAGEPVAGASVRATGESWGSWRQNARTADDGTFAIEGVRPGQARVVAMTEAWDELRAPGATDDDVAGERVTVVAGEVVRVRLVVEGRRGVIRGRVLDSAGRPVGDAFVDAERESDSASAAAGSARRSMRWGWSRKPVLTDLDGKFTLKELAPGRYTVRAFRKGGGEAFAEHVEVGATATLRMVDDGSIAGTVALAGAGGEAPEEFSIHVEDEQAGFHRSESFFRTGGSWIMRRLPPGTFIVSVSAPEGTAKQTITLAQGQELTGVSFELESRAVVVGRAVAMDTGEPIAGLSAWVSPVKGAGERWGGDEDKKNITDADGRFRVERAPAGRVMVGVWNMEWQTAVYRWGMKIANAPGGNETDIGDIKVPRIRIKPMERGGDLGFDTKERPPDQDPADARHIVSVIRADGPAASSGLQVGDEIVTVDGHDVVGENAWLLDALCAVPEGTVVRFGLARGETIEITAAKPL